MRAETSWEVMYDALNLQRQLTLSLDRTCEAGDHHDLAETSSLRELEISREVRGQPSDVSCVWGCETRVRSGAVDTSLLRELKVEGKARQRSNPTPLRVAKKAISGVTVNRSDEVVARPS